MQKRAFFQIMLFGLIALILVNVIAAFATGLDIDPSNVDIKLIPITGEDIKPPACTMYLTNIVRGSGTFTGTAGNDLILGSSGDDTIDGLGGDDCILGGGGDDLITGGDGNEVIGDICIGGTGADNFVTCEAVIDP
jgi:Ca2+-binding RTX toxin-like protein